MLLVVLVVPWYGNVPVVRNAEHSSKMENTLKEIFFLSRCTVKYFQV